MNIPKFLDRDDYLQNPIMKRFIKDRNINIQVLASRIEYINAIENYANTNSKNEDDVNQWLTQIAREGSKDICYKKVHGIRDWHKNPVLVESKINNMFPGCPMQTILNYRNTGDSELIEWKIITNANGEVSKVFFTFSQLFLYGNINSMGNETPFPVFIELYLEDGFIISRAKAKSTLFEYDNNNNMLFTDFKINTMDHAIELMDRIISLFDFQTETDSKKIKTQNSKMLFRIYKQFTFTPDEVDTQVDSMNNVINTFVDKIFSDLNLSIKNKEKARLDGKIFVEKFISINGDNEQIFKNRDAYLVKVRADDDIQLTKVDTRSDKTVPLQCMEPFFDSKKSVLNSKQCKYLNLVFKRKNDLYFPQSNQLLAQFGTSKNFGYVKLTQYAEEVDIQNVLQTIFSNY